MGKVLSNFMRGWPGTVSRSKDDVIVSLKNADSDPIAFGAPVFLGTNGGVVNFTGGVSTPDKFVGFAVRIPDKTPDTYPTGQDVDGSRGEYAFGDPVDVLVRGSVSLPVGTSSAKIGDKLYIRISDSRLVTVAGESGTTVELPNVTVRGTRDTGGNCEVTITKRNLV